MELNFDMQPRLVKANDQVEADKGMVCVQRGPLVYCAEWPDNAFNIHHIQLSSEPKFEVAPMDFTYTPPASLNLPQATYPLYSITAHAQALSHDEKGEKVAQDVRLKLIPYYAWCHRGSGNMRVWLPIENAEQ